jgi:superfamily I DNA and/or RNA helicase
MRPFDVVIIDEANQATPLELLLPMLKGRKIILIGDQRALPPLVGNQTLADAALGVNFTATEREHLRQSYFANLYNSAPAALKTRLTQQYRMRQPIMHIVNQFYDDALTGRNDREHGMALPDISPEASVVWLMTPLEQSYAEEKVGFSYSNPAEVELIDRLLHQMNDAWQARVQSGEAPPKTVGVITFCAAQVKKLQSRLQNRFPALDVELGTVDQFQGRERQIVIVSLVRNTPQPEGGLAEAPELMNVALSRAEELLVLVGCKEVLTPQVTPMPVAWKTYREIAGMVRREGSLIDVSRLA